MTTSGQMYGVGMRHSRIYALDSNALPAASSTTVYEGVEIVGPYALELTIPDARRVVHVGNDRVLAQDFLPRIEASSGVLRARRNDYAVQQILGATKNFTVGTAKAVGYGTSEQGSENDIGILMYQQAVEASTKLVNYRCYMLPVSRATLSPASFNDNPDEYQYSLLPQVVMQHLWGIDFTVATEGFTTAEVLEFHCLDIPHVVSWKGDNSATKFLFDTTRPAAATGQIHVVTVNGVVDATVTKAVDGVTPTAKPGASDIITCFYEYAD